MEGHRITSPDRFIDHFAEVVLTNITRDYPFAAHHVARGLVDIVSTSEKNPAIANFFDRHSNVHMHYLLTSLVDTEAGRDVARKSELGATVWLGVGDRTQPGPQRQ